MSVDDPRDFLAAHGLCNGVRWFALGISTDSADGFLGMQADGGLQDRDRATNTRSVSRERGRGERTPQTAPAVIQVGNAYRLILSLQWVLNR